MTVEKAIKNAELFTQTYDLFSADKLAIDTLIECAENAEKYRWHDLRKDPTDLPNEGTDVLVRTKYGYFACTYYSNLEEFDNFAFENCEGGGFAMPDDEWGHVKLSDVYGWQYIDPFELLEPEEAPKCTS